jgi:hypothetical protein
LAVPAPPAAKAASDLQAPPAPAENPKKDVSDAPPPLYSFVALLLCVKKNMLSVVSRPVGGVAGTRPGSAVVLGVPGVLGGESGR